MSESGTLRQGAGGHSRGARAGHVLVLATLLPVVLAHGPVFWPYGHGVHNRRYVAPVPGAMAWPGSDEMGQGKWQMDTPLRSAGHRAPQRYPSRPPQCPVGGPWAGWPGQVGSGQVAARCVRAFAALERCSAIWNSNVECRPLPGLEAAGLRVGNPRGGRNSDPRICCCFLHRRPTESPRAQPRRSPRRPRQFSGATSPMSR